MTGFPVAPGLTEFRSGRFGFPSVGEDWRAADRWVSAADVVSRGAGWPAPLWVPGRPIRPGSSPSWSRRRGLRSFRFLTRVGDRQHAENF